MVAYQNKLHRMTVICASFFSRGTNGYGPEDYVAVSMKERRRVYKRTLSVNLCLSLPVSVGMDFKTADYYHDLWQTNRHHPLLCCRPNHSLANSFSHLVLRLTLHYGHPKRLNYSLCVFQVNRDVSSPRAHNFDLYVRVSDGASPTAGACPTNLQASSFSYVTIIDGTFGASFI